MDVDSAPTLYTYTPLERPESIRILMLHPSTDHTAPLLCDIVHGNRHEILLDLTQKRGYEAVSYTWGDPVFSEEIVLKGGNSRLAITPNVDSMLRHVRKPLKVRRLWVDAICLNQSDDVEKGIQVGLMGEIYGQAKKVQVWLGDGTEDRGIERNQSLNDNTAISKTAALFRVLALARASNNQIHLVEQLLTIILPKDEDLIQLATMFLRLPWFRRRWTIQEAALNHHTIVRYGHEKIPWGYMIDALWTLKSNYQLRLDTIALGALNIAIEIRSQSDGIMDLLLRHHEAQCDDPRDRIAALLSIATYNTGTNYNSSAAGQWTPSYTIPWQENYVNFCLSIIDTDAVRGFGHILQHLHLFGPLSQESEYYPSWVPDWRNNRIRRIRAVPSTSLQFRQRRRRGDIYFTNSVRTHSGATLSCRICQYFLIGNKVYDDIQETDLYFHWLFEDYWQLFPAGEYFSTREDFLPELLQFVIEYPLSPEFETYYRNDESLSIYRDLNFPKVAARDWLVSSSSHRKPTPNSHFIQFLEVFFKHHSFFTSGDRDGFCYFGIAHGSQQVKNTYRWPQGYNDLVASFEERPIHNVKKFHI